MPLPESSPAAPAAGEPAHALSHWLTTAAARAPEAIAVEDATAAAAGPATPDDTPIRLTYAELAERSGRLAHPSVLSVRPAG